jgi:hypothetical protein
MELWNKRLIYPFGLRFWMGGLMKYPRLPPHLDLRRKLMPEDIERMQKEFEELRKNMSDRQAMLILAEKYNVSLSTVYYWVKPEYREWKRKMNALNYNKHLDPEGYVKHRAREIVNRAERMKRYPPLKLYHMVMSAKHEKRCKRKTVYGMPIEMWEKMMVGDENEQ